MGREGEIDFNIPENSLDEFPGDKLPGQPKSEKQGAIDRYTARERELLAKLEGDPGNVTARQELDNVRKYRKQIDQRID